MADIKKTMVFFEGDDDKAFLEQLSRHDLLPGEWELAKRSREHHPGKDGLVDQILPLISLGKHALVMIDLDELSADIRSEWFQKVLSDKVADKYSGVTVVKGLSTDRVYSWRLESDAGTGGVALIPIGCPRSPLLNEYGIDRFAIDDWVLQLVTTQLVYEAVSEFKHVPFPTMIEKFKEVPELFRKNNLEVRKAKTYIQILRAITSSSPSTATIVGRIVGKGRESLGNDQFVALLKPLLDDFVEAHRILYL
jgi:hypothetical protein